MTAEYLYHSSLRLCNTLPFPAPFRELLSPYLTLAFFEQHMHTCHALTHTQEAENTQKQLQLSLSSHDPNGLQQLAIFLGAASITQDLYKQANIPENIFWDTMDCFPRFVQETYDKQGIWCFDRGFWTWRQTACRLFALGTLEFEYTLLKADEPLPANMAVGNPVLSVHIPSASVLSRHNLDTSYHAASTFFTELAASFCTAGAPIATICHSWLLAPALRQLLPESSGIRRFSQDYTLYAEDPKDDSFYLWLFGKKVPLAQLPQTTSMQRTVREHLLQGGTIGAAYGKLSI